MRHKVLASAVAVASTTALVVMAVPSIAAGHSTPRMPASDYLDNPAPHGSSSGADQCGKAPKDRAGNWFCLNPGGATNARAHFTHTATTTASVSLSPMTDYSGYCGIIGCWDVFSPAHSDYYGEGAFGYGGEVLGFVDVYYDVHLNGGQAVDKPVGFRASTNLSHLQIEGDRLYYSATYPQGNSVNHGAARSWYGPTGSLVPGQTVYWQPNGYVSYENTVYHGSTLHEWVWSKAGYPGNWWFFAKSVKFDHSGSSYFFGNASYLGQDPARGGYHAY